MIMERWVEPGLQLGFCFFILETMVWIPFWLVVGYTATDFMFTNYDSWTIVDYDGS